MWNKKTRRNPTAKLPYAYVPTEDDPLALEPDWECIKWVEQGFDHLENNHSTRKVAAWITEKSGHKISHQGIMNLWNIHRGPDTDKPSKLLQQRAKERKKAAPKGRTAKKVAAAKRRKADAKRMITMAEKRLAKIEGTNASNNTVTDNLDLNVVKQNFQHQDVIFKPLPFRDFWIGKSMACKHL